MAIVLIIKTEDGQTTELPILGKITIGRSSTSDFKVIDSKMSGQHCKLSINIKGEVQLEDLGSTNGSFINNSRIQMSLVKLNDVIRIGNTLIKILDSKLTATERRAIGYSNYSEKNEKTVPMLTQNQMEKENVGVEEAEAVIKAAKKHAVVLNKEHLKKKRPPVTDWKTGNENVIEQEESSGMTKMLKIETSVIKKKKA
jgi:pSer/pThr/pTyr-binding forkhead associated (FHA) protein